MTRNLFDDESAKLDEGDLLSDEDPQPEEPAPAGVEKLEYFLLRCDPAKRGYWAFCGDGSEFHAKQVERPDKGVFMCRSCLFAVLRKIIDNFRQGISPKLNKKVSAIV